MRRGLSSELAAEGQGCAHMGPVRPAESDSFPCWLNSPRQVPRPLGARLTPARCSLFSVTCSVLRRWHRPGPGMEPGKFRDSLRP